MIRHFPRSALVLAFLSILTGCAPGYVDGLVVSVPGGDIRVARDAKADPLTVAAGETAVFSFERPLVVSADTDVVVFATGSGRLEVSAIGRRASEEPVSSSAYRLLPGLAGELRLPVPSGASVSSLAVRASGEASVLLSGLGVGPSFVGFRRDGPSYVSDGSDARDEAVAPSRAAAPLPSVTSVRLRLPPGPDASLVIRLSQGGEASVTVAGPDGLPAAGYAFSVRPGIELGLPRAALGGALAGGYSTVVVASASGIDAAYLAPGDGAPLADLHAILAVAAPRSPGDFDLYRWDLLPGTLVFDFVDYGAQDRYLKRLAFFAEKPGFRGRLAPDREIASLHGWNAHDYSTTTLAAFFNKARDTGFSLNAEELALFGLLERYGVLLREPSGRLGEGRGAVISISRETVPALRRVFLDHEASHALFFQDERYRRLSAGLWASLDAASRRYWITHLDWRRYDTSDEYLCVNEMQSYLVQQSTRSTASYYASVTARLIEAYPKEKARLESDAPFAAAKAVADASELDRYLREAWGLSAGRFSRLRPR